jgi:hypothetical protein
MTTTSGKGRLITPPKNAYYDVENELEAWRHLIYTKLPTTGIRLEETKNIHDEQEQLNTEIRNWAILHSAITKTGKIVKVFRIGAYSYLYTIFRKIQRLVGFQFAIKNLPTDGYEFHVACNNEFARKLPQDAIFGGDTGSARKKLVRVIRELAAKFFVELVSRGIDDIRNDPKLRITTITLRKMEEVNAMIKEYENAERQGMLIKRRVELDNEKSNDISDMNIIDENSIESISDNDEDIIISSRSETNSSGGENSTDTNSMDYITSSDSKNSNDTNSINSDESDINDKGEGSSQHKTEIEYGKQPGI